MKRSWFGAVLLLVLFVAGFLAGRAMVSLHDPIVRALEDAGEAALAENWDRAERLSRQARADWEEGGLLRACFADHGPLEEIDGCFARLEVYGRTRFRTAFAAACAETARKVAAVGEAHKLLWENFY